MSERLEGRRGGDRQDGSDGAGNGRTQTPVEIPGAEDFEGPLELRRRMLDAMREESPEGYAGAVRRYYEELLR